MAELSILPRLWTRRVNGRRVLRRPSFFLYHTGVLLNGGDAVEPKILNNILVEISEFEELLLHANQEMERNTELTFTLGELQAEYESDAAEAAKLNSGAEVTIDSLENEITQVSELLKVKQQMIVGLTDRRQVRAVNDEISQLKQRLDRLEEDTIALLDKQDLLKSEAAESLCESRAHGTQSRAKQESMASVSADLSQKRKHIENDMERLIAMLPPTENRAVIRLREKLDMAIVHHHDGACQGCFHQLPQQQAISVDGGGVVVRCPSCMRFIVHRSWRK